MTKFLEYRRILLDHQREYNMGHELLKKQISVVVDHALFGEHRDRVADLLLEMLNADDHSFDLKRQKQIESLDKNGPTPIGRKRKSDYMDVNEYAKLRGAVFNKFGVALPETLSFLEKKQDDALYNKLLEMGRNSSEQQQELNQKVQKQLNHQ